MTSPEETPSAQRRRWQAWGDGPRPGLAGVFVDFVETLGTTLRLLGRHWPALLTIFLAGVVAHELTMRGAVRLSLVNAELGFLVLLLAPMSTLTALVLMLRVVRGSLPWLGGPGRGKPTSVLTYLGSVLVPFMAIYYFDDRYIDDLNNYSYRVWEDEVALTFESLGEAIDTGGELRPIDPLSRLPFDFGVTFAAVVIGAIVARWLLSRWDERHRRHWLGIPGAYLELVWMVLVTTVMFNIAVDWLGERRWGKPLADAWELAGASGDVAAEGAQGWLGTQYATLSTVVLIPIGWLAIGAVVLGHEPPALRDWRSGQKTKRLYEGAERRWQNLPGGLRWMVEFAEEVTLDVRGRFTPLARGGWQLIRAGVPPMLLFCLLFVAVQTLADWLWELERLLIGPQDLNGIWVPLASPLGELNRGIGEAVLVCMLAATIDRVVRVTRTDPAQPTDPAQSTGVAPPTANRT